MRGGKLIVALALLPLVAGCVVSAGSVQAPTSGGQGTYTMRIHVTDEPGGPPLAGANVEVRSLVGSFWGGESESSFEVATGPDGVAVAHVDPGARVDLAVTLAGHTWEAKRDAPVGPSGGAGDVIVPLYRDHVTLVLHETLAPAAVSAHRADSWSRFAWDPHELQFGSGDAARHGYAARIVALNFTLTWNNTPTSFGDLGLGAGHGTQDADVVQQSGTPDLPPGAYQETMSLSLRDMQRAGWQGASRLYAGAGTGDAYVAPQGLPYTLQVEATFDGHQALRESPGFNALWGALVALGGVALAMPRRR
ncbi:MAG: hypothetical protein QOE90_1873 [Thermoplasmata archaeon]|jgi:hypothetical protein|nr:hypothetical protein [Thermoplasmata archaeon]